MRAAVLKVRDGNAIVLLADGTTRKIPYQGQRGDEIDLPEEKGTLLRFPFGVRTRTVRSRPCVGFHPSG